MHANACLDMSQSEPQTSSAAAQYVALEACGAADGDLSMVSAPGAQLTGAALASSSPVTPCNAPATVPSASGSASALMAASVSPSREVQPDLARPPDGQPACSGGAHSGPLEPVNSADVASGNADATNDLAESASQAQAEALQGEGVGDALAGASNPAVSSSQGQAQAPQSKGGGHAAAATSSPGVSVAQGDAPRAKPSGDALAELMRAQRARTAAHNFFLDLRPNGSWHWSWWTDGARCGALRDPASVPAQAPAGVAQAGAGPAAAARLSSPASRGPSATAKAPALPGAPAASLGDAGDGRVCAHTIGSGPGQAPRLVGGRPIATWSGVMQVDPAVVADIGSGLGSGPGADTAAPAGARGGGSGREPKVALRLLTNAPPTAGGELDGPGGGRYTGGVALLKSALQKNVRLGRVDQAHRCPLAGSNQLQLYAHVSARCHSHLGCWLQLGGALRIGPHLNAHVSTGCNAYLDC